MGIAGADTMQLRRPHNGVINRRGAPARPPPDAGPAPGAAFIADRVTCAAQRAYTPGWNHGFEWMNHGAAISIVCKTPGAGGGKSRLRPLLGAEMVQQLSACFIRDVAAALEAVPEALGRHLYALFSPAGSEEVLRAFLPPPWKLVPRQGACVGTVLQVSTAAFLADGHDCAIMVNGDSPTLPTALAEQAIAELRRPGDRAVLGPALDGGYYLVGLKRPHPRLFEDIAWSTPDVLACTLRRAVEIGLPVVMLPMWYDVDEPRDFLRLQAELSGQAPGIGAEVTSGPAHHTRAFLAAWTQAQAVSP